MGPEKGRSRLWQPCVCLNGDPGRGKGEGGEVTVTANCIYHICLNLGLTTNHYLTTYYYYYYYFQTLLLLLTLLRSSDSLRSLYNLATSTEYIQKFSPSSFLQAKLPAQRYSLALQVRCVISEMVEIEPFHSRQSLSRWMVHERSLYSMGERKPHVLGGNPISALPPRWGCSAV